MKTIKTLIVDDESLARSFLRAKLNKYPIIEVIGESKNGREAIDYILTHEPDLVFLDIEMPGLNGFDVITHVQSEATPLIVFATAFEQYALNAFNVNAIDYILKPLDDELIERAVSRAVEKYQFIDKQAEKSNVIDAIYRLSHDKQSDISIVKEQPKKLLIKEGDKSILLNPEQVKWVDAAGDYCCIHANDNTYIKRISLTDLLTLLTGDHFQRIHRSTIINLTYISKIQSLPKGEFLVFLGEHEQVKVSRTYKEVIKQHLSNTT